MECHVDDGKVIRCIPFWIPSNVRFYEIKTSRGVFTRPRKEVQIPLAYAWKRRIYENRVKYPLLRVDWDFNNPRTENRGRSEYVRISWDEALDIIVNALRRIREKYGTMEVVLVQADGRGQSGAIQSLHFWAHYLFDKIRERLGWGWWTQQVRNPDSWEGYYWGAKHVWGFDDTLGEPYQDAIWDDVLENTEMVILSGGDPEATGWGTSGSFAYITMKWLKQAGIKIVAISPDLNYYSAVYADLWIPIKPNTDAALYLAIAYVWIKEGLYDEEYVKTHTVGFDEFRKYVLGESDGIPKTPEWAEKITGVPSYTIKALAREWAKKRTSLLVYYGGPKIRGTYSHIVGRIEAYLMALQGIGKPGRHFVRLGVPGLYKKYLAQVPRYPDVDKEGIYRNPITEYIISKTPKSESFIPRTLVADAILNSSICWYGSTAPLADSNDQFKKYCFPPRPNHPGIRVIWNENGSQANSWGYGAKWIQALRSPKIEFVVAINPWLENDVLFADLILPAQTIFEHEDLIMVERSDLIAIFYQERAIDPVGESKSDYEIHRLIALRLAEELNKHELINDFPPVEELLRKAYENTLAYKKLGISWEEFKRRKYVIYDCPTWDEWVRIKREYGYEEHEGGLSWFWKKGTGLQTPSGKIEFVSHRILESDPNNVERPPLAKWIIHLESPESERSRKYPFIVVTNHPRLRFHVQGDDIDWIRELWKVVGPDGYLYEPCWVNPKDAEAKGLKTGDIALVYNERGGVLCGVIVTERIIPGTIYFEHGARMDLYLVNGQLIDRGGNINLISPIPSEKYKPGEDIKIPEMNVSGFLADIRKVDPMELLRNATHLMPKITNNNTNENA